MDRLDDDSEPSWEDGYGFVTICNDSSIDLRNLLIVPSCGDDCWMSCGPIVVPRQTEERVEIFFGCSDELILTIDRFRNPGVVFDVPDSDHADNVFVEDGLRLEPGLDVHIVDNPMDPPLTESQVEAIVREGQKLLEHDVAVHHHDLLERAITSLVCREADFDERCIERLKTLYYGSCFTCHFASRDWMTYYRPVEVATNSMNLVRQLCQGPFLVHAYWRVFNIPDPVAEECPLHYVVRYSLDLAPGDGAIDDPSVYIYRGPKKCVYGPAKRALSRNDDESLHSLFNKLLADQTETNSTHCALSQWDSLYRWDSIELNLFSRQWHPQLHPSLPECFRERVFTLLLCNNRLDDTTRLSDDCLKIVVSMLYDMENVGPIPIYRLHQLWDPETSNSSSPTVQTCTIDSVAQVFGMETLDGFGLSEFTGVPCSPAWESCRDFFQAVYTSGACMSDWLFRHPLVFRFSDRQEQVAPACWRPFS